MIHFDRFGWQFPETPAPALRDVSLRIGRGEFVAVAGPSGSGKSTLALAMCGLLVGRHAGQATGCVHVNGADVAAVPLHQVAQTIALVQQNPETHFATLTVSDELAFGMENHCAPLEEIRRRGAEAMELLGIAHLSERSLATLSGGEKQRVAVASIVAGHPEVIVLDEPTASLDPEASRDLFGALADLCRSEGLTVVIIEHKLDQLLPLKPRLIRLADGRMVESSRLSAVKEPIVREREPTADRSVAKSDAPIIEASGVTVELGGQTILEDISLRVRAGEVVAVLGPNGGGKTTLLQCLLGLVEPVCGTIRTCDLAVSKSAVSRLARQVGVVFQNADHQLVTDTVWGETIFAVRNFKMLDVDTNQEADRLLEQAGLAERKSRHPFRLSWGEKRRLNLISAILHRPRLLLLDEPFAGQDWDNVNFLLDAIDIVLGRRLEPKPESDLNRSRVESLNPRGSSVVSSEPTVGGACLMITHDPRVVLRSCTRLLFVSGGQVTVDAPVSEAFERLAELGHDAYVPAGNGELRMEN